VRSADRSRWKRRLDDDSFISIEEEDESSSSPTKRLKTDSFSSSTEDMSMLFNTLLLLCLANVRPLLAAANATHNENEISSDSIRVMGLPAVEFLSYNGVPRFLIRYVYGVVWRAMLKQYQRCHQVHAWRQQQLIRGLANGDNNNHQRVVTAVSPRRGGARSDEKLEFVVRPIWRQFD